MDTLTMVVAGIALLVGGDNFMSHAGAFPRTRDMAFSSLLIGVGVGLFLLGTVASVLS